MPFTYFYQDWHTLRDGEIYTISIGYKGNTSKFSWHYLPDEWHELQKITDAILELNKTLLI